MDKISIGIEKRVSISTLELALLSVLEESASSDYFKELAMRECSGENRARKVVALLGRLTLRNPLLPYILEHRTDVGNMLRSPQDRPLLFVALMCGAYSFFYDTASILGKYLHVQESVSRAFLLQKLSEKYGSNRILDVAFDCVMPMLIDAGMVKRCAPGVFTIIRRDRYSDSALSLYKEAYLVNNPNINREDDFLSNPYFEYIRE